VVAAAEARSVAFAAMSTNTAGGDATRAELDDAMAQVRLAGEATLTAVAAAAVNPDWLGSSP
jgi:hypothetical protein